MSGSGACPRLKSCPKSAGRGRCHKATLSAKDDPAERRRSVASGNAAGVTLEKSIEVADLTLKILSCFAVIGAGASAVWIFILGGSTGWQANITIDTQALPYRDELRLLVVHGERGVAVPILDLRIRFGNRSPTYNDQTIVIILTALDRVMGMVVDAVSDVVNISAEDIMPPPQFGAAALTGYIVGIASRDEHMLILLDIEGVLSDEDARQLDLVATANLL